MVKKKISEKGYDRVKRNIDFSHVRKHQRSTPKRKKFEGRKKWVEIQIIINIKKRGDITRRNRKRMREKEKTNSGKKREKIDKVNIWKNYMVLSL